MWKPLPWWKFRAACLAGNSCDDWSRCLGFLFTRRLLFHTAINQPQFHHKHLVQTIPKWLVYNRFNLDSGVKFWIAIDMGFYYLVQSSHSRWKCLSSQRWKILLPRMTIWIRVTHAELFGTSNQELQGSCLSLEECSKYQTVPIVGPSSNCPLVIRIDFLWELDSRIFAAGIL